MQILVHSEADQAFAEQLYGQLQQALKTSAAGSGDGSDFGSGAMNLFFAIHNLEAGKQAICDVLDAHGDARVVACVSIGEDEALWWPADYPFVFTALGPAGVKPEATSADLPGLAGAWSMDTPQGKMSFLFGNGFMVVRKGFDTISAAQLTVHGGQSPFPVDITPVCGPALGIASGALMHIEGDQLYFASGGPGDPRPESLDGPRTMVLTRI
ncbi:MAG: hypothetical protein ACE366_25195 [Bradymonadia bacterium]